MIQVEHLTRRYGSQVAVKDLSFTVPTGQICGLLGPNGAGKTTTMNVLTGYLSASEGRVIISGHDILEEPMEARRQLGYLPEQPPLYPEMTVEEYLRLVAELRRVPRTQRAEQVRKAMNRVAAADMAHRLIRNLSKGYRQRVGLAAALLGDPEVLILDEPTVGLDPAQMIEFRALIRQLGRKHTVILSSHILSEVSAVCDQVLILSHGQLMAQGTPDQLAEQLAGRTRLQVLVLGSAETAVQTVLSLDSVQEVHAEEENGKTRLEITLNAGADQKQQAAVSLALAAAGCAVLHMETESLSLEDVFLQLTEFDPQEEDPPEPPEADEDGYEDDEVEPDEEEGGPQP